MIYYARIRLHCFHYCIGQTTQNKQGKGCNKGSGRYILYIYMYGKTYTSLKCPCAQTHYSHALSFFINHTRHHLNLTPVKRVFFVWSLFQAVTQWSAWRMHAGENICIVSVRIGSLQPCWHTFMKAGRMCGMEHTWSDQWETYASTLPLKNPVYFHWFKLDQWLWSLLPKCSSLDTSSCIFNVLPVNSSQKQKSRWILYA